MRMYIKKYFKEYRFITERSKKGANVTPIRLGIHMYSIGIKYTLQNIGT